MAHTAVSETRACPSCGARLAGPYCHECGEARPDPHDFSWRHAAHDVLHEFLHLDGKIFQTLWLLIRRPGLLTAEYWDGRRRLHIRPLRLYIVLAAIHLLAMSSAYYNMAAMQQMASSAKLTPMLERLAQRQHTTLQVIQQRIDQTLARTYSVTQYLAVLAFAAVPWLLDRRRRPYYLQHVIFALHVYCFYFLLTALVSRVLTPAQWRASPLPLVTWAYLYFAVRRLYGADALASLGISFLLRVGLFAAEFLAIGLAMAIALAWTILHHAP